MGESERERARERKAYYEPLSKSDISPSGLLQSSVHTQTSSSALQDQAGLFFSGEIVLNNHCNLIRRR